MDAKEPGNTSINLLTIKEAALKLRVSHWTIYQLIRSKQLKTFTIASRRFVAYEDLLAFINDRREAPE